ncbi:protein phosphatase 2C containing protein (macronuclear) [Tetrahymena thermophila SB210]|uniref:protein-serine/threonine phosphatase n=1 Tax=Tetrahymena thermophila (strain SB210) TaxID=312017 RepID=I7LTC4_TETTS|nr:protein phosphatase 2C containing protein [Tetrahymena thermophila SB210]EAR84990.1 protein phosphatase 2C containing protein [Tetrahymena thermophila SB210]|eukprot:XP_001032653.1 protein phosphatase 2C containing protein [Tetrahymena thermophila SB210]
MGAYLTKPIIQKETHQDSRGRFEYASVCMQGWRVSMEDAHIQSLDFDGDDKAIFGVFDGHGGKEMAQFVSQHFIKELLRCQAYKEGKYKEALEQTFLRMDELAETEDGKNQLGDGNPGCTANVVLIVKDKIYCANSGDSRAIVMKGTKEYALSIDHKPDTDSEKRRIERAGGTVIQGRVNGNLNLSRALGDLEYKVNEKNPSSKNPKEYMITAFPDVTETALTKDISLIVLGCDGIWECKSNQYIVEYFAKTKQNLTQTCCDFLDSILAPHSATTWGLDNMSIIVVKINHDKR